MHNCSITAKKKFPDNIQNIENRSTNEKLRQNALNASNIVVINIV